jgi:hypothetical protein
MQVWNPDGTPVEMEAVDARECIARCGYTSAAPEVKVEPASNAPAAPEVKTGKK